ncbi:inactive protein kinase SELMODRAFT_444075-like [Pistacia vera]|uniref:inactive protein kinase SELMODRAFT_444075-like n=1 Tax=Pistacia vera TaxID=55513 RepID=UPI001263190F|nr:inactive protein kinase SELMODRAFT_444075-like [Pistacia vera]
MTNFNSVKAMKTPPNNQARRSIDSPCLQRKPEGLQKQSYDQLITRRKSLSSYKSETLESSPTSSTIERTSSIRKAMSISIKNPPMPPPLCSICKHNAPIFGKTPRKFSYKEIARATGGFVNENFLAEGGYGKIYRGVLPDGQVVAVKQHKTLSAQGASEFVSEVEVLSCAQHRNLVMLVGYCFETEWLLIYEFACNGSLDKHLYGRESDEVMSWTNRMKVAKGAARGLRYLHEDCRVGCIVHRDFRPNNILLTHDFRPMVGDFGLARWQADGQLAEETRVVGAFGYLAPEYTQTGLITEKADVYAFGVVLLELLSGFKATDFSRNTGKQFVMDWGKPLLEKKMVNEIIDPRLDQFYVEKEVECMMYATSLCISPIPEQRPTMSKVLKILEGDIAADHMAYNLSRHCTPNYPKKYINNIYGEETPICQTPNSRNPQNLLLQAKNKMNLSPPRLMPLTTLKQHKVVSNGRDLNKSDELVSEEYQEYLHESLAKFIQNLNEK